MEKKGISQQIGFDFVLIQYRWKENVNKTRFPYACGSSEDGTSYNKRFKNYLFCH